MESADVLAVLRHLKDEGTWHLVGGGWGIDALVGRQTRPHQDLDLAIDARHFSKTVRWLEQQGYSQGADLLPTSLELTADRGRRIDLYPSVVDDDGTGRQAGTEGASFEYRVDQQATGYINGEPVPCISVGLQRRFHSGYRLASKDREDLACLRYANGGLLRVQMYAVGTVLFALGGVIALARNPAATAIAVMLMLLAVVAFVAGMIMQMRSGLRR